MGIGISGLGDVVDDEQKLRIRQTDVHNIQEDKVIDLDSTTTLSDTMSQIAARTGMNARDLEIVIRTKPKNSLSENHGYQFLLRGFIAPYKHPEGKALREGAHFVDGSIKNGTANEEAHSTFRDYNRGIQLFLQRYLEAARLPQREVLRKIVVESRKLFRQVYQEVLTSCLKQEPNSAEILRKFADISRTANERYIYYEPAKREFMITDLVHASTTKKLFDQLCKDTFEQISDVTFVSAPVKGMWRIIEKLMLQPNPTDISSLKDLVRGIVYSSNFSTLSEALQSLKLNRSVRILRVKDRYANPTVDGWSDCLVNFLIQGDENSIVCELQFVHENLLLVRKNMGGHALYSSCRSAFELLVATEEEGFEAEAFHTIRFTVLQTRKQHDSARVAQLRLFFYGTPADLVTAAILPDITSLEVTNSDPTGNITRISEPGEGCENAFNPGQGKWLMHNQGHKQRLPFIPLVLRFHGGGGIRFTAIAFVTANDYPGRDPTAWKLRGKRCGSDEVVVLQEVSRANSTHERHKMSDLFPIREEFWEIYYSTIEFEVLGTKFQNDDFQIQQLKLFYRGSEIPVHSLKSYHIACSEELRVFQPLRIGTDLIAIDRRASPSPQETAQNALKNDRSEWYDEGAKYFDFAVRDGCTGIRVSAYQIITNATFAQQDPVHFKLQGKRRGQDRWIELDNRNCAESEIPSDRLAPTSIFEVTGFDTERFTIEEASNP